MKPTQLGPNECINFQKHVKVRPEEGDLGEYVIDVLFSSSEDGHLEKQYVRCTIVCDEPSTHSRRIQVRRVEYSGNNVEISEGLKEHSFTLKYLIGKPNFNAQEYMMDSVLDHVDSIFSELSRTDQINLKEW